MKSQNFIPVIHSFNNYLPSPFYVLGTGESVVKKTMSHTGLGSTGL
jgi:hypothetical protein